MSPQKHLLKGYGLSLFINYFVKYDLQVGSSVQLTIFILDVISLTILLSQDASLQCVLQYNAILKST